MNRYIFLLTFLVCSLSAQIAIGQPTVPEPVKCDDLWPQVQFSEFCGLSLTQFDIKGVVDYCHVQTNTGYPHGEMVYVSIYHNFTPENASAEYHETKSEDDSAPNYEEVRDLGDDAYAFIYRGPDGTGPFTGTAINILKGSFIIYIELRILRNDNCLDEGSIRDFARMVVESL